uniref:Uncharacterized protein n=1 Tax=Amazona collaria TaxID=241587 RepID=A0A8B9IXY2_9PSIT
MGLLQSRVYTCLGARARGRLLPGAVGALCRALPPRARPAPDTLRCAKFDRPQAVSAGCPGAPLAGGPPCCLATDLSAPSGRRCVWAGIPVRGPVSGGRDGDTRVGPSPGLGTEGGDTSAYVTVCKLCA